MKRFLKIWALSTFVFIVLSVLFSRLFNPIEKFFSHILYSTSDVVFLSIFPIFGLLATVLIILTKLGLKQRTQQSPNSHIPQYGTCERMFRYFLDYRLKKTELKQKTKQNSQSPTWWKKFIFWIKRVISRFTKKIKALFKIAISWFTKKVKKLFEKEMENFSLGFILSILFSYVIFSLLLLIFLGSDGFLGGIALCVIYTIYSFKRLTATKENPTPIALLVLFGRKTKISFCEGLCFVPALVGSLIEEDGRIRKHKFSIEDENMYTPKDDTIILFRSILIVYRISNLHSYVNITDIFGWIADKIKIALKDYISYNLDGPKTWKETRDVLNEKFTRIVVARLLGQKIPVYEEDQKNNLGKVIKKKSKGHFKEELDFLQTEKDNKTLVKNLVDGMRAGNKKLTLEDVGLEIIDIIIDPPDTTATTKAEIQKIATAARKIDLERKERESEKIDTETKIQLTEDIKKRLGIDGSEAFLRVLQMSKVDVSNTNERIYRGKTDKVGILELLKETEQ